MDFIHFEAEVDNSDGDDSFIYSNDHIDGASDISESVCEHCTFQNAEVNNDDVLKNTHEKAISDLDNASEFTNFSNPDLAEELPETVTFCGQEKRVNDFEKSLIIPRGVGSIDSFFYAICYAIRYEKTVKVDQYNNFQDKIETELYEKLLGLKERLQLKLDHHRFEERCFDINNALIEHGYFLRVFEEKKNVITVMKKDSKKQEMKTKMFLAASWKYLEAFLLLVLNTAEGNELSFCPLISYISQ